MPHPSEEIHVPLTGEEIAEIGSWAITEHDALIRAGDGDGARRCRTLAARLLAAARTPPTRHEEHDNGR